MQQPSFDTWTIIFLFASVQGFFLTLLLSMHKVGNRTANKTLALLIFLFSISLFYYVAYWTGYAQKYTWMNNWVDAIPFLYGPLTLFYLKLLHDKHFPRNFFLHFIPFVLHFIITIPLIIRNLFGRVEFLRKYIFSHGEMYNSILTACIVLQCISLIVYGMLLFSHLRTEKSRLTQYSIPAELLKQAWMKKITLFYSVFVFALLSYWLLVITGLLQLRYDYAISFTMSSFIYMVGYMGFRQPALFNEVPEFAKQEISPAVLQIEKAPENQKYQNSSLKAEEAQRVKDKLLELMLHKKPYLDNQLKIQHLASVLQISTHHLSQVMNELLGYKFSDFINLYRIEEAKKLLADPAYDAKIISIAFDVGFNNKATFNSVFKKITGMSPSEYRQYASRKATA